MREIEECSKLWRWLEGMVPSGSKGWCLSGPMKSSMETEAEQAAMMRISSMYLVGLEVGNQGGAMYKSG